MLNSRKAFTIIELIFVIIILGVLSAVAIPKLGASKQSADIGKGRADIASIRSAILSERQQQLVRGNRAYIPRLTPTATSTILFTGDGTRRLLTYGIKAGAWQYTGLNPDTYTYTVNGTVTTFEYYDDNGTFVCTSGTGFCNKLVD